LVNYKKREEFYLSIYDYKVSIKKDAPDIKKIG
jgi:hypothetical protein